MHIRWSEVRPQQVKPGVVRRQVEAERVFLALYDYAPDEHLGPMKTHRHPHEQVGILLEGEMELQVGDAVLPMVSGQCYHVPGDVEHGARPGRSGAVVLNFYIAPNAAWQAVYREQNS